MKWSKHYKASLLTLTNVCCIRKLCRLFISRSESSFLLPLDPPQHDEAQRGALQPQQLRGLH